MTKPDYKDATRRIPRVREDTIQRRALSEVMHQVAHYEAGGTISASLNEAQEIQHLIDVARFHHTRNFGTMDQPAFGRTLEYTYAILPSGRIYLVNPEVYVTWSHRNGNRVGMSTLLCLGRGQEPTQAMLDTLRAHWDYCAERPDLKIDKARSWGHGETGARGPGPNWGNSTLCPEKALPFVRSYRAGATPTPPPPDEPQNPDRNGYFKITGYSIGGAIGEYWRTNGGVLELGYPLSGEETGDAHPWMLMPELRGFTCQRFEYKALAWKAGVGVVTVRMGALVNELVELGSD